MCSSVQHFLGNGVAECSTDVLPEVESMEVDLEIPEVNEPEDQVNNSKPNETKASSSVEKKTFVR